MDGEAETRASLGVGLRELDTLGHEGSAAGNGELVAGHVVLSTTGRAGGVKSNSLGTEEVVTSGKALWNLEAELSAYACVSSVEDSAMTDLQL